MAFFLSPGVPYKAPDRAPYRAGWLGAEQARPRLLGHQAGLAGWLGLASSVAYVWLAFLRIWLDFWWISVGFGWILGWVWIWLGFGWILV